VISLSIIKISNLPFWKTLFLIFFSVLTLIPKLFSEGILLDFLFARIEENFIQFSSFRSIAEVIFNFEGFKWLIFSLKFAFLDLIFEFLSIGV